MCEITLTAQKAGCKNVGGIESFYLIDKQARLDSSIAFAVTGGLLAMLGTDSVDAYHFIPRVGTVTFTQPRTDDNVAGTSFVTQTLEFTLNKYTSETVVLNEMIAKGKLEVFLTYADGTFAYAGLDATGMESNGGDAGFSGTAKGDAVGQTYTLTSESATVAPIAVFTELDTSFTIVEPS